MIQEYIYIEVKDMEILDIKHNLVLYFYRTYVALKYMSRS